MCVRSFFLAISKLYLCIISWSFFCPCISAHLTFCYKGRHEVFSRFDGELQPPSTLSASWANCPGGVLFNTPMNIKAVESLNEPFCTKKTICSDTWQCGTRKNSLWTQVIQFGKNLERDNLTLFQDDDIGNVDEKAPECYSDENLKTSLRDNGLVYRRKRDIAGLIPSERTSNENLQQEVDDQTKRMFYYLTGINQDQVNSHLRVVQLFKMSTELVSVICDPSYIRPAFLQEIQKSFLYLLKEQGFDKVVDLELDSYNQLRKSLEHCSTNVTMVKFIGQSCPTGTKIQSIYTLDGSQLKNLKYERNEKTFKWGEYDIVLDAAWSIMNIVHGGCFESFAENVNLHHKFQVAMEQLFHSALHLRWENPTQLADDSFYDSIFVTRVNDTMEVMDACSRYVYLLTPFRIQLNRPIHETFYKRKKRSVEENYDDIPVQDRDEPTKDIEVGYKEYFTEKAEMAACLDSEEEMETAMRSIERSVCNKR